MFFGVIHQISRSHGLKNQRFESNLSKITRPVATIKSLKFALLYAESFKKGKGHKLIGHSFGRNLHKSNMAATCQEIALYFKHACVCYIFMQFKLYFHNRDMSFPLYQQKDSSILLFVEIQYGCHYQSYIITKTIVGKNLLVSIITR